MTRHHHEINVLSRKWRLSPGAAARQRERECLPVPAGTLPARSRDQAAAQLQVGCCVWIRPTVRVRVPSLSGGGTCATPHPAYVWSHTRHRLARTPFHAQLSLTCWSLPLSRKPGRAPKAMAKPQRVISSGLCSSARYFSTSPSGKKPQGDPLRPGFLPAPHGVSEAGAERRPERGGGTTQAPEAGVFSKGSPSERFTETSLGGFKVFMSNFNK